MPSPAGDRARRSRPGTSAWIPCPGSRAFVLALLAHLPGVGAHGPGARLDQRRRASRLAREQFFEPGLHLTRARTGVLIFVAVAEHYVEIIADEGINALVAPAPGTRRWPISSNGCAPGKSPRAFSRPSRHRHATGRVLRGRRSRRAAKPMIEDLRSSCPVAAPFLICLSTAALLQALRTCTVCCGRQRVAEGAARPGVMR